MEAVPYVRMNMNNVEAEVHVGTNLRVSTKKRMVIIIVLILIIIFVGLCVGFYFAGKASSEATRPSPKCTNITSTTPESTRITSPMPVSNMCLTPASTNITFLTPEITSTTFPTPESTSTTFPTNQSSICMDGWVKLGESCYFFGSNRLLTFCEAESFCQDLNAKLIEVDSDSENQLVKDYLLELKGSHYTYLMGLTDSTTEGTFLLYSSSKPAPFLDWANDEPNDGGYGEDCVSFDRGFNYSWNDLPCGRYSRSPICEL